MNGIFLNSRKLRRKIHETARQALSRFPEIVQIRLFGSLTKGVENPLSDVDIIIVLDRKDRAGGDPLGVAKPYFAFFSDRLRIAVDVLITDRAGIEELDRTVGGSEVVAEKPHS